MLRTLARRRLIAAALASAGSISLLRAPARAAQFHYKLGNTLAIEHPENVRLIQMAAAIRKETNGRFEVEIFPNSTLGGDGAMLTQVRVGAIQFYVGYQALVGISPLMGIMSTPFAFKTDAMAFAACDGAFGQYLRKDIETKGLIVFPYIWLNGFREITTSSKPIKVPADLVGLKIRTPPSKIFLDLFRALGASPTPIDLGELYTALQTRVVDGQENPYAIIESNRIFEVQRYLSVTNHSWTSSWLSANPQTWNALPADLQDAFSRNARKYALLQRRDTILVNASTADKLQRQNLLFNNVNVDAFRAQIGPLYGSLRSEFGATAWTLLEQYTGPLRA